MRVPVATYRLQLNGGFTFAEALKTLDYLNGLGVTDIYASPVFRARQGSLHGYDIVNHNELNPELGAEEDFERLMKAVKDRSMGWVQDMVPNHMAYHGANTMLMDIFEKGGGSRFINFFDIEWDHPYEGIKGKVLAPFLGRIYGEALEAGEIRLSWGPGGLTASYYGFAFPLAIGSYGDFFSHGLKGLKKALGGEHPDCIKLAGVLHAIKSLPAVAGPGEIDGQTQFIKGMLWELYSKNPEIKASVDRSLGEYNGRPGNAQSFNLLDRLLGAQSFKLSFWKVAAEEINYRRFFNINELVTLRTEDEDVFGHTHSLLFRLIKAHGATGLRIDHIDGAYDPLRYLRRLREKAPDAYIVVEKILGHNEELPADWPVEGTTGYDFMNALNNLFCDPDAEARFTKLYSSFTGQRTPYPELLYRKKKLITEMDMMSDVSNIVRLLKITLSTDRYGSDITMPGLKRALVEVMSFFPVYRTYISGESISGADRASIDAAVTRAAGANPALVNELEFIRRVLTLNYRGYLTEDEKKEWLHFAMRFQQFTGPLMAKGFEDTLLYVYNRLLSLNEVGGDPGRFGAAAAAFHNFNAGRAKKSAHSMNATSTHDAKRGEDVRARINVLSEMPAEWEERIKRWANLNRRRKRSVNGTPAPGRNDEYFLYQTLVGALPFDEGDYPSFVERVKRYAVKAVREAKIHTAWLKPDTDYEDAFVSFVAAIMEKGPGNAFLADFLPFQGRIARLGVFNSLSQVLIKAASPGVPDFYQGSELWDLNLVDPDNRRPVDFVKRTAFLREAAARASADRLALARELLEDPADGRIKLFATHTALKARREHADLFYKGGYIPLEVKGELSRHIIAFARQNGRAAAVAIAPRFLASVVKEGEQPLGGVWENTEAVLPDSLRGAPLIDAFTGQAVATGGKGLPMAEVLNAFPVALLLTAR